MNIEQLRAWLQREIDGELESAQFVAMDGGIYSSERLRTLREVLEKVDA